MRLLLQLTPKKIEELITDKTSGILATHVLECMLHAAKQLQIIGKKHGIPLLFDGAHGFGSSWKGKSLLSYGDVSICSLHATKLFNSFEGGLVIARNPQIRNKIEQRWLWSQWTKCFPLYGYKCEDV